MRTNNKPSNGNATFHGGGAAATKPWKDGLCGRCGARRIDSQIGLEKTPEAYVAEIVAVFREVRRVLADDGTLWLVLGDSYTGSGKGGNPDEGKQATNKGSQSIGVLYGKTGETAREAALTNVSRRWTAEQGLAPKNLVGIPWRVAFALQADGWYLRSDIIWAKSNPMPESVTDRPTKSHEYVFLLSKSARYFYDAAAIAEQSTCEAGTAGTWDGNRDFGLPGGGTRFGKPNLGGSIDGTRNARTVWTANEPLVTLRADLSEADQFYALSELMKRGL